MKVAVVVSLTVCFNNSAICHHLSTQQASKSSKFTSVHTAQQGVAIRQVSNGGLYYAQPMRDAPTPRKTSGTRDALQSNLRFASLQLMNEPQFA